MSAHEAWTAIVVVLGAVLACVSGGPAVTVVFSRVDRRLRQELTPEQAQRQSVVAARSHLRGGAWIGVLERLAIYATLLLGFPEGIAMALAVKGLARYPELRATSSGAAERFIIGTFVSVLVACAWAGIVHVVVGRL
ncbi:MAG: hypothetical protein M0Z51_08630 [Propionibacterium sp.]|nr:hypothetical protein [Propionibacterium sp.]